VSLADIEWGNYWGLGHLASAALIPCSFVDFMIGSVYMGKDIMKQTEVALKVERREGSELYHEYQIYKDLVGCPGISRAYWYGIEGPYNVMVMDLHKLSLHDMVRQAPLDSQTVATFATQMVSIYDQNLKKFPEDLLSYIPWNPFMLVATSIVTSSLITSWLE
jgi:hypothetical protein